MRSIPFAKRCQQFGLACLLTATLLALALAWVFADPHPGTTLLFTDATSMPRSETTLIATKVKSAPQVVSPPTGKAVAVSDDALARE